LKQSGARIAEVPFQCEIRREAESAGDALRFALGVMWLTLIVAETIAAQSGIGYMAMQAREFMQIDVVVLAIIIYAGLGKFADATVRVLERRCLSWHPAFQTKL
jgi:sulfonate transport system permease protein